MALRSNNSIAFVESLLVESYTCKHISAEEKKSPCLMTNKHNNDDETRQKIKF